MKNEEIKVSIFHHWRDAVWTSGRKALRAAEDNSGALLLGAAVLLGVSALLFIFFLGFVLGRFSAPIEVRLGQLWQQSEIERQAVALGEREDLGEKHAVLHEVGELVALPGKAVDFKDAAKPRGLVILCDRVLDGPLPGDAGKASVLREAVATEFLPEEQS